MNATDEAATGGSGEPALSSAELVIDALEDEGDALVEELRRRADNRGIEVVGKVCHGAPHEEITEYAGEVDADLVVIGYQGHSHSMEQHMGSVTDRVLRSTDRPVLVV